MYASTLSVPPAAHVTSGTKRRDTREVKVEFRAATPEEIRDIDMTAGGIVLPAQVLMTREQWRKAVAPFPIGGSRPVIAGDERSWRPPGAMIWGQLASQAGDMIVGGRDRLGFPSVPVPGENGDIVFVPTVPDRGDELPRTSRVIGSPSQGSAVRLVRPERLSFERRGCQPVLSFDGPVKCASSACDDCLRPLTRDSWYTTIACFCD